MKIDQNMLNHLLKMNDEQLGEVIRKIATESGIDPKQLGLNPESISDIRRALGSATAQDMEQLNSVYQSYRQNRNH